MEDRLLTWPEVARLVPYTRQHVARLERAERFPRRLQLGPNRVAWRLSEVQRWMDSRPTGPLPVKRGA